MVAGVAPPTAMVLVEEEGWLEDGAPLVVDGAGVAAGIPSGVAAD